MRRGRRRGAAGYALEADEAIRWAGVVSAAGPRKVLVLISSAVEGQVAGVSPADGRLTRCAV